MRGIVTVIHPDEPVEVHHLNKPPALEQIHALVGNEIIEVVQYWDQHQTFQDNLVPAIVIQNQEAKRQGLQFNFYATALWHYIAKAKGMTLTQELHGPILVITGDNDFMEAVLD